MTSLPIPSSVHKGLSVWGRLLWQEKLLSLAGRSWKLGCTYSWSSLGGGLTAGSSHVVMWIFRGRVMLDLPWGSSTAMISARPPFPASRLSTWALRTCASSNLCWRSGWVMQVGDITCPQSWPGQEHPSRNLPYKPAKWELELGPLRSVAGLVTDCFPLWITQQAAQRPGYQTTSVLSLWQCGIIHIAVCCLGQSFLRCCLLCCMVRCKSLG